MALNNIIFGNGAKIGIYFNTSSTWMVCLQRLARPVSNPSLHSVPVVWWKRKLVTIFIFQFRVMQNQEHQWFGILKYSGASETATVIAYG